MKYSQHLDGKILSNNKRISSINHQMLETIHALLTSFKWYRKLLKGTWAYVRLDLGERPCFWVRHVNHSNETVLIIEDYTNHEES